MKLEAEWKNEKCRQEQRVVKTYIASTTARSGKPLQQITEQTTYKTN